MIITCEECQASFNLDENLLKPTGSKVRCSKCNKVFVAYPPELPGEPLKDEAEAVETITEDPAEDLDMALESDLESELETAGDDTIGDLDFDFDAEPVKDEVESSEPEAAEEESDELDLSELEDMLSEEVVDEMAETDVEELDLELDLEPEKDEAVAEAEPETGAAEPDELDLTDIEKALDEAAVEEVAEEPIEDLDLELELDSGLDEAVEEIEPEADFAEADELDLSELEDMLSEEAVAEVTEDEVEELDLELELDSESEMATETDEAELEIGEPDELDLSEIEQALDSDDLEIEFEDEIEEVELELSAESPELEKVAGEEDDDTISEGMEDVDLSDIEKMLEVEDEAGVDQDEIEFEGIDDIGELADTADIPELDETDRIELVLEDSETEDPVVDDEKAEEELEVTDPFYVETQIIDKTTEELIAPAAEAEKEEERQVKAKPAAKKRVGKPVLALLILLLLGGAGLGTVFLLNYLNIDIPFVGDFIKPKVSDPSGNLKIGTLDIQSKFVDNTTSGKLLVITGQIKNDYSNVRSFIRVTGRLYASGKKLASTATVFCGNVLPDNELEKLDIATIKQRLANRTGDNNSNTQVKPGQQLPFMVVFANLPENLEEFEIEVAGSSAKQ